MQKKCPECGSSDIKKDGKQRNLQRYKCLFCGKRFQSVKQPKRRRSDLWRQYVWDKQSLVQLAEKHGRSVPWIQKSLDSIVLEQERISPQPLVFAADVSFFSRGDGVLVFRAPRLKRNILWRFVRGENPAMYREAREELEKTGFVFLAVVLDGRRGVREVFSDIHVQMCHFHQKQILKRYLTSKPKLEAGQELSAIGKTITFMREEDFEKLLDDWFGRWEDFLKEKTFESDGKHWHYTHKKIRSAYHSLKNNLPYLFTYQKYPELKIPNTTNSLDGFFSKMKTLLRVHNGLSEERRNRVVSEILNGETKKKKRKPALQKIN